MSRYDFSAQRLYVDADLAAAPKLPCTPPQANYLRNVLRLKPGDAILVFNGRDGEWRAEIAEAGQAGHVRWPSASRCARKRAGPTSTTCSRR